MGNIWRGVDDDILLEAEARILLHSGILLDRFDRKYVEIDEDKNKIRTIIVGEVSNIYSHYLLEKQA